VLAKLAQRANEATAGALLLTVLSALLLNLIPVWFALLMQNPYEICERFSNFEITSSHFDIIDDYVVYRHGDTVLAAPARYFPQSDFDRGDYYEIFDRLALLNNYYRDMLMPVMLLMSFMLSMMLITISGMLAGVMGLGRKMEHALPFGKRLRVFAVCSWLPAIPALLVGFIIPIFHVFIYQLVLIYLAWKVQKLL
jgi:ABC-type multidrug transport system permease subunit